MRIAMIGLGDIALKAYLPVVTSHPKVTPVLCTRNAATLAALAKQYRIQETYTELAALIKSQPDAVMIHSSTDSHFTIAMQCLQAGIPVFIDKPISYYMNECEQVMDVSAQKNIPIFVGFNRRYAPLYQLLLSVSPIHIKYQKNRFALPDEPRVFIFDDFIHVLDFCIFAGQTHGCTLDDDQLNVFAHSQGAELGVISVEWRCKHVLFSASMNRLNGGNEERLEYFAENQKWQIDNLREGHVLKNNTRSPLRFGDWDSTLYKRGFVTMFEQFIASLEHGKTSTTYHDGILRVHRLCERLVNQLHKH
ncbi:Gfo/Idh/MocA family protein [Alteromonas sediminis]|nr:Gfo/Idh/MocA family oxidoreductase [Alteromonas sediminis]